MGSGTASPFGLLCKLLQLRHRTIGYLCVANSARRQADGPRLHPLLLGPIWNRYFVLAFLSGTADDLRAESDRNIRVMKEGPAVTRRSKDQLLRVRSLQNLQCCVSQVWHFAPAQLLQSAHRHDLSVCPAHAAGQQF
jgi:hypothetical protein